VDFLESYISLESTGRNSEGAEKALKLV